MITRTSPVSSPTVQAAKPLVGDGPRPDNAWGLLESITRLLRALLDVSPTPADSRDRWRYEHVVAAATVVMIGVRHLQGHHASAAEVLRELDEAAVIAKTQTGLSQSRSRQILLNQEREQAVEMLDCLRSQSPGSLAQIEGLALEIASAAAGTADFSQEP